MNARLLLPFLFAAATTPVTAQFALDKITNGTLGQNLRLDFAGATPGKTLVTIPSTTQGPIPLGWFSAGDTRVLEVGFDLAVYWLSQPTNAGTGSVTFGLPLSQVLHGAGLYFHAFTAPGNPFLVDQVSNPLRVQLGMPGQSARLPDVMAGARALSAAWLQQRGGRSEVVVAGGGQGSLLRAKGLDTSESWSFDRLKSVAGPKLTTARALAVAVQLKDGRVLLAGGVDNTGAPLASAELYDPATNTFTATGSMSIARGGHAGALLGDGRVIVGGGTNDFSDAVKALAGAQASCEIFNPATGTWSPGPSMNARRLAPSFDSLSDGRVLMSGGFQVNIVLGFPLPVGSVATCQLCSSNGATWSNTGSMVSSRGAHAPSTARLPDGRILASGGASSGPDITAAAPLAKAETYNPATGSWTALPDMPVARVAHSATPIGGTRVVLAGGAGGTLTNPVAIAAAETLDVATGNYATMSLPEPRAGHAAVRTPDGLVVLFGGTDQTNTTVASVAVIHP